MHAVLDRQARIELNSAAGARCSVTTQRTQGGGKVMISMAGKAIRKWWAQYALPTFDAFIIGILVPNIMADN